MYTPNELREIRFDKAVFGGYDMAQVDKFYSTLTEDYSALFKENAVLKKKLKLLADTVEDYRSVDEEMRKALITAQKMANEIIEKAEKKSAELIENASGVAAQKATELTAQVDAEEKRLAEAKAATVEFIDKMSGIFDAAKDTFAAIRDDVAVPVVEEVPVEKPQADMGDTLDQITKSLEEKVRLEEEELAQTAPKVEETEEDEAENPASDEEDTIPLETAEQSVPAAPTIEEMEALEAAAEKPKRARKIEFENLKFGTDYDFKDEN